jgi:hypothetical protein
VAAWGGIMSGELTARPSGGKRHPWDWYVEEQWVTHRLVDVVDLEPDVTYLDPFCGRLHIPQALSDRGFTHVYGTDLFARNPGNRLFLGEHDFLGDQRHLLEASDRLSIIMNPPFSYQDGRLVRGLAEKCIRQALAIATHKVCALLPLKWLASEGRYRLFTDETPIGVWILCERPSMPPGNMIEQLGANAYAHGKIDYIWVVWDKNHRPMRDSQGRPFAPTYWIPPREKIATKAERKLAA